jgi:signal transduction histidine kinase
MNKYKILYVDDEESNLRIFKDTFRRDFDVYTAISGQEGLKILESTPIDLILSDQRMPEMSGVEFLQRTLEKYPKSNRILVTGYSDISAIENAINNARVFQYIQKPWNEQSLKDTIKDALRLQQLERENARQKEELLIAKQKAEESDMLKTEFINNMSHEIRTPINGIFGFSALLYDQSLTNELRKEYVDIIQNCSMQLVRTFDDIMEISKLVTKQETPNFTSFKLNELFSELFKVYENSNENENITFTCSKDIPDVEIVSDRSHLYTILSKILDNAFKYTELGHVKLSCKAVNKSIVISVEDTGIGIEQENQEEIFKRFSKEKQREKKIFGGLGLGLSIALESSKLINAEISLESVKGRGTTFFVQIPTNNKTISKPEIQSKKAISEAPLNNFKILIAEDEETNYFYLELLIKRLLKNNVEILRAENGKIAIDICEANPDINLIFMDIKMPLMDGHEATKKIKELDIDVPIVAQTAYSTTNDKEKALNNGINGFMSKPIKRKELESILGKYLSE